LLPGQTVDEAVAVGDGAAMQWDDSLCIAMAIPDVVFPVSMADFLTNPVKISFGSFSATFTAPAVIAPPTATPNEHVSEIRLNALVEDLPEKTHPPAPFDLVAGMDHVINMMMKTLQICEQAQRPLGRYLVHSHVPFGLRSSVKVYSN
jgi:hypothetical protein